MVEKSISPEKNTWAAHAQLVKDASKGLAFDVRLYENFDKIIAQKLGKAALYDPAHIDYGRYSGLRTNIAVLRNFILSSQSISANNVADNTLRKKMESMAIALGDALGKESRHTAMSLDIANIEGAGAAAMYSFLAGMQQKQSDSKASIINFRSLLSLPDREWNLPPLDSTPFTPASLATANTDTDLQQRIKDALQLPALPVTARTDSGGGEPFVDESVAISDDMVNAISRTYPLQSLADIPREESIEEARKILRLLRNMEFTDRSLEEWLDLGTPQAKIAKKESLHKLARIFAIHLHIVQLQNQAVLRDAAVENARDTVAALALAVAENTLLMLPDNDPRLPAVEDLIDSLPEQAEWRQQQPVARLIESMELGLERVSGQEVSDISPENRLIAISERIQSAAYELHSSKLSDPPEQGDSIELVRDVIRKMKSLPFADQPIHDFINQGKVADKAAFAQQIGEMVDIFRNLMSEAAQQNPQLLDDQQVKEANNAVGGFAHAVKLMAAKEMPNSIAAAQQISAEAARQPEQWKDLHDRTINRLIKSAEGGLEKAIDEVSQQKEEDREEEMGMEGVENALHHADQKKRRKKRRGGGSSRSGKGGKKQKKQALDMTADDYVLKQGRFSEDVKLVRNDYQTPGQSTSSQSTAAMAGIKPEDLAAIQKLGGSLRDIGNQLKDLSSTVTAVSANDKIAPDDKTVSQRILEREQQAQQPNNPRGTGGPRVS